MKIALLQAEATPLDVEANLSAVAQYAATARKLGAELLLTPELWVTGYAPRKLSKWLTPEKIETIRPELSRIAREEAIAIAASFPLARPDGSYAIAAGFWDETGTELLTYEKVHLWGELEPLAFTPSADRPRTARWNGRTVGFLICYDIEFPEPARDLAARGVDLLLVPTAIDGYSTYVPEVVIRTRAAENAIVVAYANHASAPGKGSEPGVGFTGLSTVAGREGLVLAQAGHEAVLLIAELPEVGPIPAGQASYLTDRRPALYAEWRAESAAR